MPEKYLRDRTHVIKDFKELLRDEDAEQGLDPVDSSDEDQEDPQQVDKLAINQEDSQTGDLPAFTSSSFSTPTTSSTFTSARSEPVSYWGSQRSGSSVQEARIWRTTG